MASAAPPASDPPEIIEEERPLAQWLSTPKNNGRIVQTKLRASERVIARVTDGIYRQPGAALRELISNAWDADAKEVSILTDAPRFSRIYIRDDGAGITHDALSHLLHSIGGSAKRRQEGAKLHLTAPGHPDLTPMGRPLIGKIGIGLFSVSQLSRRFRMTTKVRGASYRLIADVRLRTYSEDTSEDAIREDDDTFVSGEVFIRREPSDDKDSHGTDILLDDIKPRVRDLLRSADRWRALEERAEYIARGDEVSAAAMRVAEPQYHAGWIGNLTSTSNETAVLARQPQLPWSADDPPETRMGKLLDAVENEAARVERPDLATTLDTYLETLWTLALSVPVSYVDKHPFDLTGRDNIELFCISNEQRGQSKAVRLPKDATVREAVRKQFKLDLTDGKPDPAGGFRVVVDGVELRRPIRFKHNPTGTRGLSKPLLFVGKYTPDLGKIDRRQRGGDLSLEAYLFWNGRIIPKENNGVLVRIHGASGSLFDPTFFKYQISEQTRLRQITSEIFVHRGLDAALNIDRESFNFAHPHVQLTALWLHRAIRQLTNKHKELSSEARQTRKAEEIAGAERDLLRHADRIWEVVRGDEQLPHIELSDTGDQTRAARKRGNIAFDRTNLPSLSPKQPADRAQRAAQAKALIQVLSAYGVLEDRSYAEQEALVEAILQIFYGPRNS